MPNFIVINWVKDANNLLIRSWVGGVRLSPVYKNCVRVCIRLVGKVVITQPTIHFKKPQFSTSKYLFLYPLNNFYTHNPQALLLRPLYRN